MILTFEIFGRARNHGKKFLKLCQTSFSGVVHWAQLSSGERIKSNYLGTYRVSNRQLRKDVGPGVVCPSCSFYHDPLRYSLFCLVRYKAHIHKLGSNNFSEPVRLILEPHDLK